MLRGAARRGACARAYGYPDVAGARSVDAYRSAIASISVDFGGIVRPRAAPVERDERALGGDRDIGVSMFGPKASAIPKAHIAQVESRRSAVRNERIASAWLNAQKKRSPWSKYCCASGEALTG